jgi:hypothetical protein
MGLNAALKNSGSGKRSTVEQPLLKIGGHAARLVQVIDLGLQPQRPYKGQAKDPAEQVYVTYELSHDFMIDEEGKANEKLPRWISETFVLYNLKNDKAKSTERYNALDPEGVAKGDWSKLGGAPANLLVVNNEKEGVIYNNVGGLSAAVSLPGYVQPELVNPFVFFDLSAPSLEVFNGLPTFLQEKIKGNLNYQGSALQALLGETAVAKTAVPVAAPVVAQEEEEGNPY